MKTKTRPTPAKKTAVPFRAWLNSQPNPDQPKDKGMSLDQFVREATKKNKRVTFSTAAKWSAGVHVPRPHDQKDMAEAFPSIRW